jgi:hypothetical protein
MIEGYERAMRNRIVAVLVTLGITASPISCQRIKRIFIKPPLEGVIQESYTIKVYAYQSSVLVKATPQEVTAYTKKLSLPEDYMAAMEITRIETKGLMPGMDIEAGQSVDSDIKILGFTFPLQLITFKYELDKELWTMILSKGSWVLLRWDLNPMPEGSMLNLNVLGQPSKTLAAILDTFQLAEAAAARIDLWIALVQSNFDPELDAKQLTEKGLRGELYKEFFQADEASIWMNAGQEEVAEYIITNLESYLPEMKIKDECNLKEFMNMQEGQILHCPAVFEFLNLNMNVDTFFTWVEKDKNYILRAYAPGRQNLIFIDFSISPEAGGSLVNAIIYNEIPEPGARGVMDIMMALAAVPKRLGKALLDIKQGIEGVG